MPKHLSRAAALARQIHAATGIIRYTDALALVTPNTRWLSLAAELRTAGCSEAANNLTGIAYVCAEAGAWFEACGLVEQAFKEKDYPKVQEIGDPCLQAAEAALRRAGFESATWDTDAEAYHAAFLAFSAAGTGVGNGQSLARAGLLVLDSDPLMCSDIIRTRGRAPFTYRTVNALTGPDTPVAVAARKAARFMAAASTVGHGGDEDWDEAAALMVEAAWHACLASGRMPLQGLRGFRLYFKDVMRSRHRELVRD
ncbi:hypothetical protein OIE69_43575 (plasmid) [Actinacidiphila glaucinigra]|uniref:hypothetical protein n=1 Tax=Actinacidiphila glaucinigra TaxID=235986 RepID=UPI002DDC1186|nr:hypothetical protein [Actinacidiphila glaucinigra]WSD65790.1 hypothetical protein OIE69_43575 [Actinacidiphila glaucinigra]